MGESTETEAGAGVDEWLRLAAVDALEAYLKTARRRIRAGAEMNALAFKNPEPNALLAVATVWHSRFEGGVSRGNKALADLVALTRPLLEQTSSHNVAIDAAGLAWADAYGLLPIRQPPIEQLEWVLESGTQPRSIKGVIGSAWRAAFLASTYGVLDWQHRPVAEKEIARWQGYLHSKLDGLKSDTAVNDGAYSLPARLAFALGLAGQRLADQRLVSAAESQLASVNARQAADGSFPDGDVPSAVLAQLAAANSLIGDTGAACRSWHYLLSERRNGETGLIGVGPASPGRNESSPWVALSLLPAAGASRSAARSWRQAVTFGRRR